MSTTAIQSPLGVNVLGELLQSSGLWKNPVMVSYVGECHSETQYTPGTLCNDTCLRLLTYSINDAYVRGVVDDVTYENLISIGAGLIPALGNAKPTTFTWAGPADTGDPASLTAQSRSWNPYTLANSNPEITCWGYIRLLALQGRHEANYNDTYRVSYQYKDILGSWMTAYSFIEYSNAAILSVDNAKTFLEGTYSNMDDLMSADITGANLSTVSFGQDLISSGKAIDLSTISKFGLPSNLLMTMQRYNAITSSVSLALLTTGMSTSEIRGILDRVSPITHAQERYIYAAFSIIIGQDLTDVCIPLNCKTRGLYSLADLLNPLALFPSSYSSLTVPVYNPVPTPTNSKTYYPIYEGTGVSPRLSTLVSVDFGSYLRGILPGDIAIAAGAFGVTMQQIRNISSVPIEKFAQVVGHIETTKGLTLVNGSTVPVNLSSAEAAIRLISLGSGPQGTYTMSDFFGAASGLPYNVTRIQEIISMVRDVTGEAAVTGGESLYDIYKELYLAVTWKQATATPVPNGTGPYTVVVTMDVLGGGYCRAGAAVPTVTINGTSGLTATAIVGTDSSNISTFGRVTGITVSGSTPTAPIGVTIDLPPGTGSFSNLIVQGYIDDANAEIAGLRTKFTAQSNELNTLWDDTGTQLTIEQRARTIGFTPVPTPRDNTLTSFPTTYYSFVDSVPRYGLNTSPHMYAQTLEAISNMLTVGGQSIVALMRQARNQDRLALAGITLDDSIPAAFSPEQRIALTANSTDSHLHQDLPPTPARVAVATSTIAIGAVTGIIISSPGIGYTSAPAVVITSSDAEDTGAGATATATLLGTAVDEIVLTQLGTGYTVPPLVEIVAVGAGSGATATATIDTGTGQVAGVVVDLPGSGYTVPPIVNIIPAIIPAGTGATATAVIQAGAIVNVIIDTPGTGYVTPPLISFAGGIPTTLTSPQRYGVYVPSNGTYYITNPAFGGTSVIGTGPIGSVPNGTGAGGTGAGGTGLVGQPVDTGKAAEPGSLAGSPYTRLIPSNLNVMYTSDILLPATLTPAEAINEVTACNCDCWVSP